MDIRYYVDGWYHGYPLGRWTVRVKNSKNKLIHVGPEWAVQGEPTCITLLKRRITEKGKEQWDAKGYFNNITDCFHRMVDLELNPKIDLEDVVRGIDDLKAWIKTACESITL